MQNNKKIVAYLAIINLNGLITIEPIKCYKKANYDNNILWDKTGNFDVNIKQRFQKKNNLIKYWSYNKREVELFIMGARSVTTAIKNLTDCSY